MRKPIKKLVEKSYANGKLNEKIIGKIASLLSRKELKQYIDTIKKQEKKSILYVDIPFNHMEKYEKELKKMFPGKTIEYRTDPNLILGIRITDNDNIYEVSLEKVLEDIRSYVKDYD